MALNGSHVKKGDKKLQKKIDGEQFTQTNSLK